MTHLETTLFNVTLSSFNQAQDKLNRINAYAATMGQLCELSPNDEPISLERLEVIFKDMASTSADAIELIGNAVEGIDVYVENQDDDVSDDIDNAYDHDLMPKTSTKPNCELKQELASAGYLYLPDYKVIRMTPPGQNDGNRRYLVPSTAHQKSNETMMMFLSRVGIALDKPVSTHKSMPPRKKPLK